MTIASEIAKRTVSAVEVLDAHIARIERVNPYLNAIVRFDFDRARRAALEADAALARGEPTGPLQGVPFTLKDMHPVQGIGASLGTKSTESMSLSDGVIARRLKAAGAVFLGKTNMGLSVQTLSEQFGRTSNPYDVQKTTGGSSGGAAAAVCAGLSAFDVGTDLSGSIRMPAHFCGVFGLRATPHRIPIGDMLFGRPGSPRTDRVLGSVGPLARTAEDVGLLFRVLAGPDPSDPEVPPVAVVEPPDANLRRARIAVAPTPTGVRIASDVSRALEALATTLEDSGAHVEIRDPVVFDDLLGSFRRYFRFTLSTALASELAPPGARPPGFVEPTPAEVVAALDERDAFIRASDAFFRDFDAVIYPAAACTAFRHCDFGAPIAIDGQPTPSMRIDHPTIWSTYTGCPSLVVPVAVDRDGLPIGAQVVGRRWGDERLVALGKSIADLVGALPAPSVISEAA
jgi:amidase